MNSTNRATILIAEDDAEDREFQLAALEASSIRAEVRFVEDGGALLDYLYRRGRYEGPDQAPRPDLILLDLVLPSVGGSAALELIKADPDLRGIPIVVLSSSEANRDVTTAYALGASGYVTKPSTHEALTEAMTVMGDYWLGVVRLPGDTARH